MITKEKLTERLDALKLEFEKQKSNLEALHGAILDTQYWLTELEKPVEDPVEKKD